LPTVAYGATLQPGGIPRTHTDDGKAPAFRTALLDDDDVGADFSF
jgi:hypothetical protein